MSKAEQEGRLPVGVAARVLAGCLGYRRGDGWWGYMTALGGEDFGVLPKPVDPRLTRSSDTRLAFAIRRGLTE